LSGNWQPGAHQRPSAGRSFDHTCAAQFFGALTHGCQAYADATLIRQAHAIVGDLQL
jgi:hypothetical protein